ISGHAGTKVEQLHEVASVERQILDRAGLQRASQNSVGRFHQREGLGYGNLFGLLARLKFQVDTIFFADLEHDVLAFGGLESPVFAPYGVVTWNEARCVISTRLVCSQGSRRASFGICDGDGRAADRTAGLIRDASQNASRISL